MGWWGYAKRQELSPSPRMLKNGVAVLSWGVLGRLLGDHGAVVGLRVPLLGLSWAIVGPS
eukprot:9481657-Pyramimonas_sp.AAC.1